MHTVAEVQCFGGWIKHCIAGILILRYSAMFFYSYSRLSQSEQLHKLRVQFASREEELERTKSALTAERFQK